MNEFKLFNFTDVFTYKRGTRLIEENQIPGDIPYVSSTKSNNGISAFITPPEFMIRYNNKMTIANSGSVGYCFYHNYEFVASDHVTVIGIKDSKIVLNKYIALYLKPLFECMKYKYNFGREISDKRIQKEKILLPINQDAKPDWNYMERYVKDLESKTKIECIKSNNLKNEFKPQDMEKWHTFAINEILSPIESCKCSNASLLFTGDEVPYIGAKKKQCGVIKYVLSDDNLITKGNCIAFICDGDGSVGYSNYIPFDTFIGTTNLTVGYNDKLNKYNALFLVTILDCERSKYSFGRKYKTRISNTKIKLPFIIENNKKVPDWDYMEQFIRKTMFADKI